MKMNDLTTILFLMASNIRKAAKCHAEYLSTEDCCCCNECPMHDFEDACLLRGNDFELMFCNLLDDSDLNAIIPPKGGDD